jgi:glucose/arabinose dehydrogenase
MRRVRTLVVIGLALSIGFGATASATGKGLADPIPGRLPRAPFSVSLETVATGLVAPTYATFAPGVPNRLFVTDQPGKIWSIDTSQHGIGHRSLFADLTSRSVRLGDVSPGSSYDERGLLGLAFAPDYQQTGLVYTYQTQPWQKPADFSTEPGNRENCRAYGPPFHPRPCQNVITEWHVRDPHDPNTTIDPTSARELMRIDKPEFNHNAGTLAFGPDGYLYISVGDGGFGDDQGPGHVAGGNAQSLAPGNVLGKILRIDPRGHNSANHQYGIPATNPFVGRPGADEIYAYGLRNPYRISFDPVSGKLYATDTGQNNIEEVDVIRAGANYGWHLKEGTFTFDPGSPHDADDGVVTQNSPHQPAGLTDPIAEYDHTGPNGTVNGEAAVGGFVYRGRAVPQLAGRYVFGDYSRNADENEVGGRLFIVNQTGPVTQRVTVLPDSQTRNGDLPLFLLGFGRDNHGELYVLGNTTGGVSGTTGVVQRITQ